MNRHARKPKADVHPRMIATGHATRRPTGRGPSSRPGDGTSGGPRDHAGELGGKGRAGHTPWFTSTSRHCPAVVALSFYPRAARLNEACSALRAGNAASVFAAASHIYIATYSYQKTEPHPALSIPGIGLPIVPYQKTEPLQRRFGRVPSRAAHTKRPNHGCKIGIDKQLSRGGTISKDRSAS